MSDFKKGDQVTPKQGFSATMLVISADDSSVVCHVIKTGEQKVFHPNELTNHGQGGPMRIRM